MPQYGDNIFSTLHNRVIPCPSSEPGASGSLRAHWDGKTSVLDDVEQAAEAELEGLLNFERTRTHAYSDFTGSPDERIRGGKSEMGKIFGRGPAGGRSQEYRAAIVTFLQDRKVEKNTQNAAKVSRDFRKKLDQLRVLSGIKKANAARIQTNAKDVTRVRAHVCVVTILARIIGTGQQAVLCFDCSRFVGRYSELATAARTTTTPTLPR
jgi:hypothetical protein